LKDDKNEVAKAEYIRLNQEVLAAAGGRNKKQVFPVFKSKGLHTFLYGGLLI
jgi:hypothetical protein